MVDNYAVLFNRTPVGRASDSNTPPPPNEKLFILVGWGRSFLLLGPPGFNWCFSFAPELVSYLAPRDLISPGSLLNICESSFLIHHGGYHDLFVCP